MHTSSRLEVIDQFRGCAMMMMVLANYSERIESVPRWLRHAPDVGLTVIDLGAPVFIFASGQSLNRRNRNEQVAFNCNGRARFSLWLQFTGRGTRPGSIVLHR